MPAKPTVLITGVSGALGVRLLKELQDYQVIGVDVREPVNTLDLFRFERVDLAEERSCDQLLDLMRSYRPEAVAHLAFVSDLVHSGVTNRKAMWHINVIGTSRVIEAIAEHNRMVGGIDKFIFSGGATVYGPEPKNPVKEDSPLQAHSLPLALHQQEADLTIQARARGLRRCKTYILRSQAYAGSGAQNYRLSALRSVPGGTGRLAERLRRRGVRLSFFIPSRGNYLDHRLQFVHTDDVARLIAHIVHRNQADPPLTILNVAGRGEPLSLRRCIEIAGIQIKQVPTRALCREALRLLWNLGVSDVPDSALPYLLGSNALDTARLRVFLEEHYRSVIQHTSEDALRESFARSAEPKLEAAGNVKA
jgi:nucleoside-diphosphate-sugar epimerase